MRRNPRPRHPRALVGGAFVAGALLLAAAGPARAIDRYELEGEHTAKGAFTSEITLRRTHEQDLRCERVVTYADGSVERAEGPVVIRVQDELRAELTLEEGLSGALPAGDDEDGARRVHLTLRYDPEADRAVSLCVDAAGQSRAEGGRAAAAPGASAPREAGDDDDGRLLALAKDLVRDELEGGIGIRERLGLLEWLHVGVGTEVELIEEHELSREQHIALTREPERAAWIDTRVEGGIRLPFGTTIPLGDAAHVSVGYEKGAELYYRVSDLYEAADVDDLGALVRTLKEMGERSLDLPLTAEEALETTLGAEREVSGRMTVALRGRLGVGYEVARLGEVAHLGASARVGGTWRVRRHLRLKVTRLEGDEVRVQLVDGEARRFGMRARALLGLAFEDDEVEELEPTVEYLEPVVDAAASGLEGAVESVLRFELELDAARIRSDEIDVAWRFDLSQPAAREAYEQAVRGDFTGTGKLAAAEETGVSREFRIFEHEERTYRRFEVGISELFSVGRRRSVSVKDLVLEEEGADARRLDVYRYAREEEVEVLFGLHERERRVAFEVVRRAPRGTPESDPGARSLRYRLEVRDPGLTKGEMLPLRRAAQAWGLPGTSLEELPRPGFRFLRSRYGDSRVRLWVALSEEAVAHVLAQDAQEAYWEYAQAWAIIQGDDALPPWAVADGREDLRRRAFDRDEDVRRWRRGMHRAEDFVEALAGLEAARTDEEWGDHLTDLAENADDDLYAATALLRLAPREAARVRLDVNAERIDFDGERRGADYRPPTLDLYGH